MSDVLEITAEMWDFTGPVPLPKDGWMACPVCRHEGYIPKNYSFNRGQPEATIPYRCDATFKCGRCAAVWYHGIVLGPVDFARYCDGEKRSIPRPEIRRLLDARPVAA